MLMFMIHMYRRFYFLKSYFKRSFLPFFVRIRQLGTVWKKTKLVLTGPHTAHIFFLPLRLWVTYKKKFSVVHTAFFSPLSL